MDGAPCIWYFVMGECSPKCADTCSSVQWVLFYDLASRNIYG